MLCMPSSTYWFPGKHAQVHFWTSCPAKLLVPHCTCASLSVSLSLPPVSPEVTLVGGRAWPVQPCVFSNQHRLYMAHSGFSVRAGGGVCTGQGNWSRVSQLNGRIKVTSQDCLTTEPRIAYQGTPALGPEPCSKWTLLACACDCVR